MGRGELRELNPNFYGLGSFWRSVPQIDEEGFSEIGNVFQIGVPPRRIDITTIADGVNFDQCFQRAIVVTWEGIQLPVISRLDLIANKQASGRPQDLVDVQTLKSLPKN